MDRAEEVRDFYERMPYPAPLTSLDDPRDLYKNPDRRRALLHRMWPAGQPRGHQEILVAGCGTSQAARHALREPEARITAIDVSETSLRHTRELKQKRELSNLELHQLPIESVRDLGRTFDQIVCTGVLHHLPDPDLGLRSLRDVLHPQGAMNLMVYAPYGRAGIYMVQAYCRLLDVSTSESDLRDLGAVARSSHAARLAALPSREQHAAVELFRGTMVSHNLIAYRDDRVGESQQIDFTGDAWREYVPIRLPWTVCVRERLPAGCVAVLINRAHTFTDLVLSVDSFEDRLLDGIDGQKTLADILQAVAQDGGGERKALGFFERLWQYDQIVFDASGGAR